MLEAEEKNRLFILWNTQRCEKSAVKGLSKYLAKNNLSKTELLLLLLWLLISASE